MHGKQKIKDDGQRKMETDQPGGQCNRQKADYSVDTTGGNSKADRRSKHPSHYDQPRIGLEVRVPRVRGTTYQIVTCRIGLPAFWNYLTTRLSPAKKRTAVA